MIDDAEWEHFDTHGYVLRKGVLDADHLQRICTAFDEVWETESAPCNQHKLLKYEPFIALIEHPSIIDQHEAVFGSQTQLLQYDLLRQGPIVTVHHAAGTGISRFPVSTRCRSTRSSIWMI